MPAALAVIAFLFSACVFAQDLARELPATTEYYFKTLDAHEERGRVQTPASLAKIWTAIVGLESLRVHGEPKVTVSWLESADQPGTAYGLTIDGGGAPEFDPAALIQLLKRQKIGRIAGGLTLTGEVAAKPLDRTRVSDSGYCYNARRNAVNFGRNCVRIVIDAGGARFTDPDMDAEIRVNLHESAPYNGSRPHFEWLDSAQTRFAYVLDVWLKDSNSRTVAEVLVPETRRWLTQKFGRLVAESGVDFVTDVTPAAVVEKVFQINARPLKKVICEALRDSVNIYAEAVFHGVDARVRADMRSRYPGFAIVDGAGLSRENRMAGDELFALLREIQQSEYFEYFMSCLPTAGRMGTLKTRLQNLSGRVVAKTASLTGLSHLAGFYEEKGEWRPFVFMVKDTALTVKDLRSRQDSFLTKFLENR